MDDTDFILSLMCCILSATITIPLTVWGWGGYLYGLYIHKPLGGECLLATFTVLCLILSVYGFRTQLKISSSFKHKGP